MAGRGKGKALARTCDWEHMYQGEQFDEFLDKVHFLLESYTVVQG